jgi:hypothetical protein
MAAVALMLGVLSPALSYDGERYRVCGLNPQGDNYLSLRTCGSTRCAEIARLGPNTYLFTPEPFSQGRWRQVVVMRNYNDMYPYPVGNRLSGWVYDRYICDAN